MVWQQFPVSNEELVHATYQLVSLSPQGGHGQRGQPWSCFCPSSSSLTSCAHLHARKPQPGRSFWTGRLWWCGTYPQHAVSATTTSTWTCETLTSWRTDSRTSRARCYIYLWVLKFQTLIDVILGFFFLVFLFWIHIWHTCYMNHQATTFNCN